MNRKAQIAPFMVLVVAVLILAIAATMLIGEAGFQRIRLANIADGTLLSAASNFCQGLNQIRMIHKRMFLNYIQMQVMLLFSPRANCPACAPCPTFMNFCSKALGYEYAWIESLYGIQTSALLYLQARKIAGGMAKDLRVGLYEGAFGGALVDEPKPFLESEVIYDTSSGRVTGLDYTSYIKRDSHFTETWRNFKSENKEGWYGNDMISYSWNKTQEALAHPGQFNTPDPSYESYLKVSLQNVPRKVSVKPMPMVLIFFWCKSGAVVCWSFIPGFVINPFAWIRKIDIGSNNFGLTLEKRLPFRRFPFFGNRDIDLRHSSRVKIRGSVWTGYEFNMEH